MRHFRSSIQLFSQEHPTPVAAPPIIPNTSTNQEVVVTGPLRGVVTVPQPVPAVGAGAGKVSTVVPEEEAGEGVRGECPPWTERTLRRDTGASRGARDAGVKDPQGQGNPTN